MKKSKYTKELLESIVVGSISIGELLDKLKLKRTGGNYSTLKKWIRFYNIDTSNFKGQKWAKGLTSETNESIKKASYSNRLSNEEIFCENSKYENGCRIIKRLIVDYGKIYQCEICKLSAWLNKDIVLQLHHKNGIHNDNRPENLILLCPNCHSQTKNFCGRNIKIGRLKEKYCKMCGRYISKYTNTWLCQLCKKGKPRFNQRKVKNRPSVEVIKKQVEDIGYCAVGRRYGVSDNAIRKWLKSA